MDIIPNTTVYREIAGMRKRTVRQK